MSPFRHELAIQAIQQNGGSQTDHLADDTQATSENELMTETQTVDLNLNHQELATNTITQPDIGQSGILTQTNIQDALNTASLDQQLQQTLNQQVLLHLDCILFSP